MYLMHIPPEKVEDTRNYFRTRGGVLLWQNQEIGVSRPEIMTPATTDKGEPFKPPHWGYGNPQPLQPKEIGINKVTPVPLPPEWFPKCDYCEGTGRYPLAKIAKARHCSIVSVIEQFTATGDADKIDMDTKTIGCWGCDATGHIDRYIRVALRKRHWGYEMTNTGKRKAAKIAAKLGPNVKWSWQGIGYGRTELVFYTQEITPFTLG